MKAEDLKKQMMRLWKDTFHDSDEYVSLIFNSYFDPEMVAFEEMDGEIVSALLGVPYEFGNNEAKLKGLYLCGLATNTKYRSRGIMSRLLSEINRKASEAGFAFTFLIPQDSGLRKYYRDRDYVNAFYRVVDNYTSLHDFNLEYESVLLSQKEKVATLKRKYYESLSSNSLHKNNLPTEEISDKIRALITEKESSQDDLQIIHSSNDIDTIIKENLISDGAVIYCENGSGQVTSVAFVSFEGDTSEIRKIYSSDLASRYKVLLAVKEYRPENGIRHLISSLEMDRQALWLRTYGSFMEDAPQAGKISITERVYSLAAHAKVYGMVRVLNLHEILKFQATLRHDLKYSILVKSEEDGIFEQISAKNGVVSIKKIPAASLSPDQVAYVMSKRDLCEILFRRRDTDNMITEAFGIPSINGAISLMLD